MTTEREIEGAQSEPKRPSPYEALFGVDPIKRLGVYDISRVPFSHRFMAAEAGIADVSIFTGTDFVVYRRTGAYHSHISPEYAKFLHEIQVSRGDITEPTRTQRAAGWARKTKSKLLREVIPATLEVDNPYPEVTSQLHCVGNDGLTPGDIELNAVILGVADPSVLDSTPWEVVDSKIRRRKRFRPNSYGDPDYARDVIALDVFIGTEDPKNLEGSSFYAEEGIARRKQAKLSS
jgi:hypothetical protein